MTKPTPPPDMPDLSPEAIAKRGMERTLQLLLEPATFAALDAPATAQALLRPEVVALVPGLSRYGLARLFEPPVHRGFITKLAEPGRDCERTSVARLAHAFLRAIDLHEGDTLDGTAFKALVREAAAVNKPAGRG